MTTPTRLVAASPAIFASTRTTTTKLGLLLAERIFGMKPSILVLLATPVLALAMAATASAEPPPPGTPGEPNCQGHTTAFMAQKFAPIGEPGLARTASEFDRTVKEEVEWIYNRCNP